MECSPVDSKHDQAIKCSICITSFDSLEQFQIHANSLEHALKVMLKANSNETPSSNSIVRNDEMSVIKSNAQSTTKQGILPKLNDNQLLPSYGKCEVCSKIFSGPEPYKQHLESQGQEKYDFPLNQIKNQFLQMKSAVDQIVDMIIGPLDKSKDDKSKDDKSKQTRK